MSVFLNFARPFTTLANISPTVFSPLASLGGGGRGKITIWWFCLYSAAKGGGGGRESKINRCFSPGTPKAKEAKEKRSSRPLLVRFSSNILFSGKKRVYVPGHTPCGGGGRRRKTKTTGPKSFIKEEFPFFFLTLLCLH